VYVVAVLPSELSHLQFTEAITDREKKRWCDEHHMLSEKRNMTFINFYVSDKYKFVFCNTPKVASTSWQLALTRLYVKQASVVKFYNLIKQRTSEFMQYGYHLQHDEMQQRLETHYKFMIAREPLERLLSAYRMFFVKKIKSGFGFAARRRVISKVKGESRYQLGYFVAIMYTNVLANILHEAGVTVRFFADGVKMYARITNYVGITFIQKMLRTDWAGLWQLLISITKCNSTACMGGSVAEWLACWTQAQKGPGSNRSRDAVG